MREQPLTREQHHVLEEGSNETAQIGLAMRWHSALSEELDLYLGETPRNSPSVSDTWVPDGYTALRAETYFAFGFDFLTRSGYGSLSLMKVDTITGSALSESCVSLGPVYNDKRLSDGSLDARYVHEGFLPEDLLFAIKRIRLQSTAGLHYNADPDGISGMEETLLRDGFIS